MYRTLKAPLSVQVEMTERCNSSCLHCYNHWRCEDARNRLNEANVRRIVEEFVANEVFDVTITGGEPLLQPAETLLLARLLRDGEINFSLNTNLRLLTPEFAYELKETGLRVILTSFVSHDRERHARITQSSASYDQVVRGIQIAIAGGFAVAANMVLSKINIADLRETARFLHGLGVKNFCATKMSPPLDTRDVRSLLLTREEIRHSLATLKELEGELGINVDILECYPLCLIGDGKRFAKFFRRSCVAGVSACTVSSDGSVRPCSHASRGYGNILTEPLSNVWKRMEDWRDGSYIPLVCKTCRHLQACTGGCRIDAFQAHGDMSGLDPCTQPEHHGEIVYPDRPPLLAGVAYQFPPFNTRREDFGHVIYSQKACFPVNERGFEVVAGLRFKTFTLDEVTGDQRDFLRHLVGLGFASPVPPQEEQ